MRITKVLRPLPANDDPPLATNRFARALNDQLGTSLHFNGERRQGQSRTFQWAAAGSPRVAIQLTEDEEFGFWYAELKFDEQELDAHELNRCVEGFLTAEDTAALIESSRQAGPEGERSLIAAALALRDVEHEGLAALVSERLRSGDPESIQSDLMAAMLLRDPSVLPALAAARRLTQDVKLIGAIDHLESMLVDGSAS
jgi:hypothetical protein